MFLGLSGNFCTLKRNVNDFNVYHLMRKRKIPIMLLLYYISVQMIFFRSKMSLSPILTAKLKRSWLKRLTEPGAGPITLNHKEVPTITTQPMATLQMQLHLHHMVGYFTFDFFVVVCAVHLQNLFGLILVTTCYSLTEISRTSNYLY